MYKPNTKILGTLNNDKNKKSFSKKMKYGVLIEETLRKSRKMYSKRLK
jgi:hypothetical protein